MRMLVAVAVVGVCAGQGAAQFPGQPQYPTQQYPGYGGGYGYGNNYGLPSGNNGGYGPNVMPNIYNPANQPLSPYLNLLRGGNAGVNYFYGVRPGTVGGGSGRGGGAPFIAMGGNRTLFFPQLANSPDPLDGNGPDPGAVLPPAGHPVVFNNTLGYFPGQGTQAGGQRGGLGGLGTARQSAPPAKK